jgi:hypothetical protein
LGRPKRKRYDPIRLTLAKGFAFTPLIGGRGEDLRIGAVMAVNRIKHALLHRVSVADESKERNLHD